MNLIKILVSIALCSLGLVLCLQASIANSKASAQNKWGFEATPQSVALEGLAPGDAREGKINVTNVGLRRVSYDFRIAPGGEPKDNCLYHVLSLTLTDPHGQNIYSGKLSDVYDITFDSTNLEPGESHFLTWLISLPRDTGNQYQNKKANYDIILTAQGDEWGEDTRGGSNGGNRKRYGGEVGSPEPGPGEIATPPGAPPGTVTPDPSPTETGPDTTTQKGNDNLPFTGGTYGPYLVCGTLLIICGICIGLRAGRSG